MESTLTLQRLTPADWCLLKAARLHALCDSPHAFISHYDDEVRLSESDWRRLFAAAPWVVAQDAYAVIGLAASLREPAMPSARHIESIWVAPARRRRGVFRAMLCYLAELERDNGVTDLLLWVLDGNHDAQRAYETLGFEPTGERQFLPAVGRFERRFTLCIRHPPDLAR